ncbi:MAG: hypothetical protein ACREVE_08760 [Gammaproteobacteria bacterium]
MAFLLFDRVKSGGKTVLHATSEAFSLAGYNLIYLAWQRRGMPLDDGWHVTADELIRLHSGDAQTCQTKCLVIDFDPKSKRRIGLVELLDVYAFTWGDGSGAPSWTPVMLRMRDLFYTEYTIPIDQASKDAILAHLDEPSPDTPDFIEFLYLNGPMYGWNWGKNGMTNAVFLQGVARDYFRQFF